MHVAVIVERCIEKQRAARGNNKSKHRSNKHIEEDYFNGCFVQHERWRRCYHARCMYYDWIKAGKVSSDYLVPQQTFLVVYYNFKIKHEFQTGNCIFTDFSPTNGLYSNRNSISLHWTETHLSQQPQISCLVDYSGKTIYLPDKQTNVNQTTTFLITHHSLLPFFWHSGGKGKIVSGNNAPFSCH